MISKKTALETIAAHYDSIQAAITAAEQTHTQKQLETDALNSAALIEAGKLEEYLQYDNTGLEWKLNKDQLKTMERQPELINGQTAKQMIRAGKQVASPAGLAPDAGFYIVIN